MYSSKHPLNEDGSTSSAFTKRRNDLKLVMRGFDTQNSKYIVCKRLIFCISWSQFFQETLSYVIYSLLCNLLSEYFLLF